VRDSAGQFSSPKLGTGVAAPDQIIDQVFDFATKMLESQRGLSKQMLSAATAAAESTAAASKDATKL
jgi:hypothetical protein